MVTHEFLWGHMVSFCLGIYLRVELLVFSISEVGVVSFLILTIGSSLFLGFLSTRELGLEWNDIQDNSNSVSDTLL